MVNMDDVPGAFTMFWCGGFQILIAFLDLMSRSLPLPFAPLYAMRTLFHSLAQLLKQPVSGSKQHIQ